MQAKKAVGVWKKRTWTLSRTSSSRADTTPTTTPIDDTDADDEGEDDALDDSPIERTDSIPAVSSHHSSTITPLGSILTNTPPHQLPTSPPQHLRKSSLSNAVRRLSIAGLRGRRKVSAGNSNAASASQSGAGTPALDGAFDLGSPVDAAEMGRG